MKDKIVFIAVAIGVVLCGYLLISGERESVSETNSDVILSLGDNAYTLEIADTPEKRVLGLSGRESLGKLEGMLFVFDKPGFHGIWMKDMNFDIDILWLDQDKRVVHIKEHASPSSYPTVFYPRERSRYVIELKAGEIARNGITQGDILEL